MNPTRKHVKSPLSLRVRDHMASISDSGEGEALVHLNVPSDLACNGNKTVIAGLGPTNDLAWSLCTLCIHQNKQDVHVPQLPRTACKQGSNALPCVLALHKGHCHVGNARCLQRRTVPTYLCVQFVMYCRICSCTAQRKADCACLCVSTKAATP